MLAGHFSQEDIVLDISASSALLCWWAQNFPRARRRDGLRKAGVPER
jgi:hypothetical protein